MLFNSEEERLEAFLVACEGAGLTRNEELERWLYENGFFNAPASTKYHGAYPGGLFDHSYSVCGRLEQLTKDNHLEWQRPQSPFIVGMYHDLCKCDQYIAITSSEYVSDGKGMLEPKPKILKYEYNPNTLLKGHGTKTLMILSQFINLTEEEMLCIRYHMGAYGNEQEQKDEWAGFDKAIHKYPNVLWAHMADMLASKVDDV